MLLVDTSVITGLFSIISTYIVVSQTYVLWLYVTYLSLETVAAALYVEVGICLAAQAAVVLFIYLFIYLFISHYTQYRVVGLVSSRAYNKHIETSYKHNDLILKY